MPFNHQPKSLREIPPSCRLVAKILLEHKVPFFTEWEFHKKLGGDRNWRHDFFIPCPSLGENLGLAVEVEGGMRPDGGFTRHNIMKGFAGDAEKYAVSQCYGNYVYRTSTQDRVTRKVMRYVVGHYYRLELLDLS